jgi:hypothetical protein
MRVLDWLLDSDPAVRWQAMRRRSLGQEHSRPSSTAESVLGLVAPNLQSLLGRTRGGREKT